MLGAAVLLDPINLTRILQLQKIHNPRARLAELAGGILQLGGVRFVLALAGLDANQLAKSRQRTADLVAIGQAGLTDAKLPAFLEFALRRDLAEKPVRDRQDIRHRTTRRAVFQNLEETFFVPRIVEPLDRTPESELGKFHPDVARGDLFHRVSLVENHKVVRKKQASRAVLGIIHSVEKREEERMVQHHHPRIRHAATEALVVTSARRTTGLRRAKMLFAPHLFPHRRIGLLEKITERAVLCRKTPLADALQLGVLGRGEQIFRLRDRSSESGRAEVVLAAFQQHRLELLGEDLLHERNVFEHELLLQRDRVCGNDGLLFRANRVERGWNQIRERLSNTRAGLDHQMRSGFQGPGDGTRHALLLGAVFKSSPFGKATGLGKNVLHLELKRRGLGSMEVLADRNHRGTLEVRRRGASQRGSV